MAHEQFMRSCAGCGVSTMHVRQKPNHILHLLLSVFTIGIWLPVWVLLSLFRGKPQCMTCGKKPGLFGVGFLFFLVLIGAFGYVVVAEPLLRGPAETGVSREMVEAGEVAPSEVEPLSPAPLDQEDPVLITFLNVGQGDAILVRSPEGQTALIDSGPGFDIIPSLIRLGVDTLDLVVASHPHADHIGGMWQVLQSLPVRFYMDNGQPHTTATYRAVMRELQSREEITYLQATPRTINLGSTQLHVLPLPEYRSSNLNNASVGLVVEHGSFRAFLSGDSERSELGHFLRVGAVPDVTLLKVPHHGASDALSRRFLDVASPELIVISVGGNSYGHPNPGALFAYQSYAEYLLRTDLHGEITVSGKPDGSYEVFLGETIVASGAERPREGVNE